MAEAMQFIVGIVVFLWIIGLGIAVLMIVAMWKIFEKAGEPGWASLVPFYNSYELFKISWGNGWYFLLSVVPALIYQVVYFFLYIKLIGAGIMGMNRGGYSYSGLFAGKAGLAIVMLLIFIAMTSVSIITFIKLAKVFGQGGGFACGLIFLAPVFFCILAFSKSIFYVGLSGKAPPYGRPYGENPYDPRNLPPAWQDPYNRPDPDSQNQQKAPEGTKFCADCGTALSQGAAFCSRCGKPQ